MNPIKFTFAFLKLALLAFTVSVPCHGDVAIQKSAAEIQRNLFDELEMRTDRLPTWDECEWAWSDLEIAPAHQMLFESGHPRPGEGIRIAHIDTGVIPFPLLKRQQDSSKKSAGLNYSTSLPSNNSILNFVQPHLPPLDNNEKGLNFGHGTETASLVVGSLAETNVDGWSFRGVAPWADLYPIKVTDSVVMVGNISTGGTADLTNLASGIERAAALGVHVITVSLGAIFDKQHAIQKAIDNVLKAGSIVIAAGGQTLPLDVIPLPAKLPGVVAVTASTREKLHWKQAFSGKNIAWAAPGENVCHFGFKEKHGVAPQTPNTQSFHLKTRSGDNMALVGLIRMSSGTSYSTAFTAGAAALWLQHHGPTLLAARYGQKNISRIFLAVAKTFAMDVPSGWDTQRHGSGILNVRKLLQAPLPCLPTDSDDHCSVKLSRFLTTASR